MASGGASPASISSATPPPPAPLMPKYTVNPKGVEKAKRLIESRQYVLDSEWGEVQPRWGDATSSHHPPSEESVNMDLGVAPGPGHDPYAFYSVVYGGLRRSGLFALPPARWAPRSRLTTRALLPRLPEQVPDIKGWTRGGPTERSARAIRQGAGAPALPRP